MTSTTDTLNAELVQQTELFNKLRIENSDPIALEESRKRLGEIKRQLAALRPGGKDAKKRERLLLKTPKVRLRSCLVHRPAIQPTRLLLGDARLWPWRNVLP